MAGKIKTIYPKGSLKNMFRGWKSDGKEDFTSILFPLLITLIPSAILYYFLLPAVNLKNVIFWFYMAIVLVLYFNIKFIYCSIRKKPAKLNRILMVMLVFVAAFLIVSLYGTRLFHAKRYSQILSVQEDTVELIPTVEGSSSIALMDTSSAEMLGDRRIGSLSQVVSQFNISDYTQINYQNAPYKIAALSYDGFFKWNSNKNSGIPGYVIVDPVDMSADYIALSEGMKYVPSAYFSQDLYRRIRFAYPTLMTEYIHFEIDEEGKPYYVASVYDHTIGLFGGKDVIGAIVIDPISGEMNYYESGSVPNWVDVVYSGDLICDQYNDYAQLHHGFWNSVFAQKDCRRITTLTDEDDDEYSDYGYIAKDGDIWIYTGVTSVNGDSSNIGFVMANERTHDTRFISCAGADEFSAMRSAEGEIQEKRYVASFPSLINIEGSPAYIMVLKDNNGLVKMYAIVNVEQYNIVATATTQSECIARYRTLLNGGVVSEDDVIDTSSFTKKTITIERLETIVSGGDTYIYIVDTSKNIYHAKYADVLGMLMVKEGDTITILTDNESFVLSE